MAPAKRQILEVLGCRIRFVLRRAIRLSVWLLVFLSVEVLAQQSAASSEQELKIQRERTLAISIVEQTASEAPLWDDKKSAVTVLAEAADLLWAQSPASARSWLMKAWELVDSLSDEPLNPNLKLFSTRSNKTQLRSVVLQVAHKHDPKLAETFIKRLETEDSRERRKSVGPSMIVPGEVNSCWHSHNRYRPQTLNSPLHWPSEVWQMEFRSRCKMS